MSVPDIVKGQPLTGEVLSAAPRAINALELRLGGMTAPNIGDQRVGERFRAVVTDAGPDGSVPASYSDARYFVKALAPGPQSGSNALLKCVMETIPGADRWLTATHLGDVSADKTTGEITSTGRTLKQGDIVEVEGWYRATVPPSWFYVIPARPAKFFPVKIEKDGGADGDASTAATWTYTVRDTGKTTTLGTAITLTRPRPFGEITFQTGSDGYGVAFYDGGILRLWDAGEVETAEECGAS